jgi:exodeoxyribonuclease III
VLCGDLNVARTERDVHPKERKPGAIGQLPEERALIERILSRGLVDLGRQLDPDNDGLFTWWAPWRNMRQRNIGWRLDYVMASQSLAAQATSCPVQVEVGTSDHAPVMATFS